MFILWTRQFFLNPNIWNKASGGGFHPRWSWRRRQEKDQELLQILPQGRSMDRSAARFLPGCCWRRPTRRRGKWFVTKELMCFSPIKLYFLYVEARLPASRQPGDFVQFRVVHSMIESCKLSGENVFSSDQSLLWYTWTGPYGCTNPFLFGSSCPI